MNDHWEKKTVDGEIENEGYMAPDGYAYENFGQYLDAIGYNQVALCCPECGCYLMERNDVIWDTEIVGDGVLEIERICPSCEWSDVTYDG